MNIFERTIGVFSPKIAMRMFKARGGERRYAGASHGALTKDLFASMLSAKAEISTDIVELRKRSRMLVRDDSYAKGAVKSLSHHAIGVGIRPSLISDNTDKGTINIKKEIEKNFLKWCGSTEADFYGVQNFYGIQQLVVKAMSESGECLVLKRYKGTRKKATLQIQVLETDYLVHWMTMYNEDKTYVLNGIHFDSEGRVTGYEIYEQHPGDYVKQRNAYNHRFVSVDDCILMYVQDRPEQPRGVPEAASGILDHIMYGRYELAEAHRKQIATSYATFITTTTPEDFKAGGDDYDAPDYTDANIYGNYAGQSIPSGQIVYTRPGESIQHSTPPAAEGYLEYAVAKLRKMAKSWGLSYEVFSGDFSNVNFSSAKMGQAQQDLNIESLQELVVMPRLCNKVAEWYFELEELKGNIAADAYDVIWTAPRKKMIDPVKETKAIIEQVQAGLLSPQDAIKQMGNDPIVQLQQFKEWYDQCVEAKVVFSTDYTKEYEILLATAQKGAGDGKPKDNTKSNKAKGKEAVRQLVLEIMEEEKD